MVWCPKYRRKVLVEDVETRLKELIKSACLEKQVDIIQMEVMPDHVHLFVKAAPIIALHFIVNQLKGYTSRLLRIEYPHLRSRLPTLWSRSYYCESIGDISEKTIERYIADQKNK